MVAVSDTQNSTVGWQSGPTERGTLTLVYSCLITIFACTWTVLHLNVPGLKDGPWEIAIRKAKWMAITILFPEFIFSKAICDLRLALYDLREFDKQARGNYHQNWTITHAHLANMGGVVYQARYEWYQPLTGVMLGSRYTWDEHPLLGFILDKKDIEDKRKADLLLRSLTVLQASWVIVTAIARSASGLPVSQLEIATSAFSLFAAATYTACWWKPKDVSKPIRIHQVGFGRQEARTSNITQRLGLRLTNLSEAKSVLLDLNNCQIPIPNDTVWMEGKTPFIYTLMACSSFIFGGIHLIAWNFEFPSYPELILWRVSSLISSVLPLVPLGLNLYFSYRMNTIDKRFLHWLSENLKPLEALQGPFWESLKSAPKGIYENTLWTRFLPNFS
ncbi:hypothetical protein F4808DRAFT_472512 [Astrocystis sublimbata]|nr:hypothetical protein F4808DRAFT_472512 [Astrocystis sublimbata]